MPEGINVVLVEFTIVPGWVIIPPVPHTLQTIGVVLGELVVVCGADVPELDTIAGFKVGLFDGCIIGVEVVATGFPVKVVATGLPVGVVAIVFPVKVVATGLTVGIRVGGDALGVDVTLHL